MTTSLSAVELATLGLPGLPRSPRRLRTRAAREGWHFETRERDGAPSERVYPFTVLPAAAQRELARRISDGTLSLGEAGVDIDTPEERTAKHRVALVELARRLKSTGLSTDQAYRDAAAGTEYSPRTLRRWDAAIRGLPRSQWFDALMPRTDSLARQAECHPEAWEYFKADWLRGSKSGFAACYRRLLTVAKEKQWSPIPHVRTLSRRIEREVSPTTVTYFREGPKAVAEMYPAQERDHTCFTALEACTADGHRFDVWVLWPDGTTERPILVGLQDILSGKLVAWKLAKTESADLVRETCGQLCCDFGIPSKLYFDNGRAFAAKEITGGCESRFRWSEDVVNGAKGVLIQIGIDIRWTLPYSGRSKPIERAWRDLCEDISRHPAFEGAYCGNSPTTKPHNYGERAVPLAEFEAITKAQIIEHNAREGRRSKVCGGKLSFDQVFDASYATTVVRRLTEAQHRILFLASETVTASRTNGSVKCLKNTFYAPALSEHTGESVVLRFDHEDVSKGVYVYTPSGDYICHAPMLEATGFNDRQSSRDHARARGAAKKAWVELAKAERTMAPEEVSQLHLAAQRVVISTPDAPTAPAPAAVRPLFGNKLPTSPVVAPTQAEQRKQANQEQFVLEVGAPGLATLPRRRQPLAANE